MSACGILQIPIILRQLVRRADSQVDSVFRVSMRGEPRSSRCGGRCLRGHRSGLRSHPGIDSKVERISQMDRARMRESPSGIWKLSTAALWRGSEKMDNSRGCASVLIHGSQRGTVEGHRPASPAGAGLLRRPRPPVARPEGCDPRHSLGDANRRALEGSAGEVSRSAAIRLR